MSRLEEIKSRLNKVASKSCEAFIQYNNKSHTSLKQDMERRKVLFEKREEKRSPVEKRVSERERIIRGKDESSDQAPSVIAKQRGLAVARLHEMNASIEPKGFGTGFLIAPNLLLTNHHVFESAAEAENCVANFGYEPDEISKQLRTGQLFKLRPDLFFYNYEDLDYAVVYVDELSISGTEKLTALGTLPLIETKGKVKKGSLMNIIQYPQGGYKKYTTEENSIINIDDEKGDIFYYTDTQVGSSGSPGFNEYWEVAALHYTGVPDTNEKGEWLTKKKEVWNKNTMSDEEVNWIANAGKSVSKIISHLRSVQLTSDKQKYIHLILDNAKDPLASSVAAESTDAMLLNSPQNSPSMDKITMNFYGTAYNYFAPQIAAPVVHQPVEGQVLQMQPGAVEKKERFDENYNNRKGYNENFIPGFKVPMPEVKNNRERELYKNFGASVPYIIPYHHFSLVMNKKRRMAMWTAANVSYNEDFRDERKREDFGSGAWRLDKRVPAKYQIQADEFYDPATLVDKGHMVRRDDNCWAFLKNGETDSLGIEYANADTYHWTNCTPQHEAFNRDMAQYSGVGKWGILENAIKKQLEFPENDPNNENKDYGQRACVLSGPILDNENDPEYMDIQYPLQFWKVFAIKSKSAGKLVYGFILSQKDKVETRGLEKEGRPRFERKVKAMQASLAEIEDLSGIVFDASLHEFDVMGSGGEGELGIE